MQKLRLTLFWTVETGTGFRRFAVSVAEIQNKQTANRRRRAAPSVAVPYMARITGHKA